VDFHEAEKYLLSLGNEVEAMKLGLENIRRLLAALGNPQNNYLKVQVAGTNGKGSVCAFLNSICLRAGINTGLYTSPHLVSITERLRINGADVSEADFASLATRVRDTSETLVASGELETSPTFFEQVSAIALCAFADERVELAILETGLGGRLDATTAANAEIAAITRIDIDHQEYLGNTLAEIAAEKAAIIHEGSRVVIGEQDAEAMEVILERCRAVGVAPMLVTTGGNPTGREGFSILDFGFWILDLRSGRRLFADASEIQNPKSKIQNPRSRSLQVAFAPLGLAGRHQIENAKVAVAVAELLSDQFPITEEDILTGLKAASHPGRLERIGRFLLDGAHNVGGALALREYLDEFIDQPITMIFGSMKDKDVKEIASILFPKAQKLILTRPDNSRALPAEALRELVPIAADPQRLFVTTSAEDAISKAYDEVSTEEHLIVVTGSLYLVGEVKRLLTAKSESET
jgi:dihydrofolate synthase/folylpolyglutamate synthase